MDIFYIQNYGFTLRHYSFSQIVMIDFSSKLYATIRNENPFLVRIKFYSILRILFCAMCNVVLPIYLRITSNKHCYRLQKGGNKKSGCIIVTLTTFHRRIGRVWIVIESILRQKYKPDMIILWLSKEEFPTKECLPKSLLRLQERGLQIELRDGNLMSHKKYYYTLTEYPHDHFVTIDDDIIYPSNFIESLLSAHKIYPDCILARFAFRLRYDEKRELLPYAVWSSVLLDHQAPPSYGIFFGSGGGTFFPAGILGEEAKNISLAMRKCKYADDVWLNTMCRLNKKKVAVVDNLFSYLPILYCSNFRLTSINNAQNQNDVQIANLRKYYSEKMNIDPYKIFD